MSSVDAFLEEADYFNLEKIYGFHCICGEVFFFFAFLNLIWRVMFHMG